MTETTLSEPIPPVEAAEPAAAPIRILLVEDSPVSARVIQHILAKVHTPLFALEWVESLGAAKESLTRLRADIILLDLGLPDADGLEAFIGIHNHAPGIPVVILTGLDDESVAVEALQKGAQDYLTKKEVNRNSLVRSLRYAIERRRAEERLAQSQKLESIGQLAAGIAHEINTPTQFVTDNTVFLQRVFAGLINALNSSQSLLDEVKSGTPNPETIQQTSDAFRKAKLDYVVKQVPRALDQSLEGLGRVAKLVSAMKDFSHPSQGEKEPVDLSRTIETTLTVARSEWRHVAEVSMEFDPSLPFVPCVRDEFNQVILNMVVNSAHAIADAHEKNPYPDGKGKITIRTKHAGDRVEITISDSGCGIPTGAKLRIFDPFFTTKAVGKGTGQGLAIARSIIVDRHGGTITVDSEVGRGTTFTIRLPLNNDAP